MFSDEQLKEIQEMGITICKKTYVVKYFSPNKFASYIARTFPLIYNNEEFYKYKTGKWDKVNEAYVLKRLRDILHTYYDDIWCLKYEKEYIAALKRIILYEGDLNSNKRYINLLNGMYDLETFTLVEHSKEFYSTIQIPI